MTGSGFLLYALLFPFAGHFLWEIFFYLYYCNQIQIILFVLSCHHE